MVFDNLFRSNASRFFSNYLKSVVYADLMWNIWKTTFEKPLTTFLLECVRIFQYLPVWRNCMGETVGIYITLYLKTKICICAFLKFNNNTNPMKVTPSRRLLWILWFIKLKGNIAETVSLSINRHRHKGLPDDL